MRLRFHGQVRQADSKLLDIILVVITTKIISNRSGVVLIVHIAQNWPDYKYNTPQRISIWQWRLPSTELILWWLLPSSVCQIQRWHCHTDPMDQSLVATATWTFCWWRMPGLLSSYSDNGWGMKYLKPQGEVEYQQGGTQDSLRWPRRE
jgi:hypothetical protein